MEHSGVADLLVRDLRGIALFRSLGVWGRLGTISAIQLNNRSSRVERDQTIGNVIRELIAREFSD